MVAVHSISKMNITVLNLRIRYCCLLIIRKLKSPNQSMGRLKGDTRVKVYEDIIKVTRHKQRPALNMIHQQRRL